jgi:16S rRNA (guanine527-N7)-methyltransferase
VARCVKPGPEADSSADRLGGLLRPTGAMFGIDLSASLGALAEYAESLLSWNRRINLTGARDIETLATEHIADALALAPYLPEAGRWADVGSGGGLPGLVLAILRRDLETVLIEPLQKRRGFLTAIARDLDLANVQVVGDRLEQHLSRGGRGAYDVAISRAVFPLVEWLELGRPLVRSGTGVVLGLEGSIQRELPADAERLPYDIGRGQRAIIRLRG